MDGTFTIRFIAALVYVTAQKMKFSIKDFFSKCDQIRGKLRIWSNLLKKSLMENFINSKSLSAIFCACVFIISNIVDKMQFYTETKYKNLNENTLIHFDRRCYFIIMLCPKNSCRI